MIKFRINRKEEPEGGVARCLMAFSGEVGDIG